MQPRPRRHPRRRPPLPRPPRALPPAAPTPSIRPFRWYWAAPCRTPRGIRAPGVCRASCRPKARSARARAVSTWANRK
ncbi:hypothetical protein DVK02_17740 [Halobellus sp. Atlit-31R]|nr:hypothetical protein DVK02_17740 [Halobellus sp. Atlit-31R]